MPTLHHDASVAPPDAEWDLNARTIHPEISDGAFLDTLKQELERRPRLADQGTAIGRLMLMWRVPPLFRLPGGALCYWAQNFRCGSTSIDKALCDALPALWMGPRKSWKTPPARRAVTCYAWLRRDVQTAEKHIQPISPVRKTPALPHMFHTILRAGQYFAPIHAPWAKPDAHHAIEHAYRAPADPASIDVRFCVVRDPVERFLSTWAHRDLRRERARYDNKIEKLVVALEASAPGGFAGHLVSQTKLLRMPPSGFTHIFALRQLRQLEEFLSDILHKPVRLPQLNAREKHPETDISPALARRIQTLCAEDYEVWGQHF